MIGTNKNHLNTINKLKLNRSDIKIMVLMFLDRPNTHLRTMFLFYLNKNYYLF